MAASLYLIPSIHSALSAVANDLRERRQNDPLEQAAILIPNSDAERHARQFLGNQAGTRFLLFSSLSRALLREHGVLARGIDNLTIRRLVSRLLAEGQDKGKITSFSSVASKPGFVRELTRWLLEMKEQGISPADYARYAQKTSRDRDFQLAYLFTQYQRYLDQNKLKDNPGLDLAALDLLKDSLIKEDASDPLYVLGFDYFSPVQLDILGHLKTQYPRLAVYLLWNSKQPSSSRALSKLNKSRTSLEAVLGQPAVELERVEELSPLFLNLQENLFNHSHSTATPTEEGSQTTLKFVAAPSREDEIRWTLRRIKVLQLHGVPSADIAVLAYKPEIYRPLIQAIAGEYRVAVDLKMPLADTPAANALIRLLELSPRFPWRETLDSLRSPYFSQPWLTPEQIDQLERLSRERPVISGWSQWQYALQPVKQEGSSELAAEMSAGDLIAIEQGLKAFFDHIKPGDSLTYADWSEWLRLAILGAAYDSPEEEAPPDEVGASLNMIDSCSEGPMAEADLEVVEQILDTLNRLVTAEQRVPAVMAGDGYKVPWDRFRQDLLESLRDADYPVNSRQGGLIFRSLSAARALSVPYLFVIGLAEGEFPGKRKADLFYDSAERAQPDFPLEQPDPAEEAGLWWQVISCAQKQLVLLRPWIDENGAQWLPSPYYTAVLELAPGLQEEKIGVEKLPAVDQSASFSELLVAMANEDAEGAPLELLKQWDAIQQARHVISLRQGWQPPGKFEGIFQNRVLVDELGQRFGSRFNWSASRLNRYGSCPYGYFAEQVLDLQPLADPDEGFDVLQRGSLLHEILEDLFRQLTVEDLPPTLPNLEPILEKLDKICVRRFAAAPLKHKFRPTPLWKYEQEELRQLLRALIRSECEGNGDEAQFKPRHQELSFGFSWSKLPSFPIEDSVGTRFSVRGFIDRVDVDDRDFARVLDYKSGRGTTSKSDILRGLAFQTPLYALAVANLAKDVSQVAESAYLHIPLRDTSGKLTFSGPVAEDEIVQAVVDRAGLFVERIRAGVFPSAPGKPVTGSGLCSAQCQLAGICRVTRTAITKANNLYG